MKSILPALLLLIGGGRVLSADPSVSALSARNTEVPFFYAVGGSRSWPIFSGELRDSDDIELTVRRDQAVPARGSKLRVSALRVTVSREGYLTSEAPTEATAKSLVEITVRRNGKSIEQQQIEIRPAPPNRPLSYVADVVDDLIRIYWNPSSRRFRPITKDGLDQYFRRLQAQGITRLIVWQSPFPLIADPQNYVPKDWARFMGQARAILNCEELSEGMRKTASVKSNVIEGACQYRRSLYDRSICSASDSVDSHSVPV